MSLFSEEEEPLLTGTDTDILNFIDADRCLVIDWRESEEDTLWATGQWLPEKSFAFHVGSENSAGDALITMHFQGRESVFTLPPRPQNNFRTLLRAGHLLLPEYEIRLFRCTEGDDTPGFLLRSSAWWSVFRDSYPERYTAIFSPLETLTRLWELDASPKASPAPEKQKPKAPWWKRR